jgi:hypothetical protein
MMVWPLIFMTFLYRSLCSPLENICDKWQVIAARKTLGILDSRQVMPRQALPAVRHTVEPCIARSTKMLDIIMLAIGLGFFALSVGYTIACDRL